MHCSIKHPYYPHRGLLVWTPPPLRVFQFRFILSFPFPLKILVFKIPLLFGIFRPSTGRVWKGIDTVLEPHNSRFVTFFLEVKFIILTENRNVEMEACWREQGTRKSKLPASRSFYSHFLPLPLVVPTLWCIFPNFSQFEFLPAWESHFLPYLLSPAIQFTLL